MMHWRITNREFKRQMRKRWLRLARQLHGEDGAMSGCAYVPPALQHAMFEAYTAVVKVRRLGREWWKNA